MINAPNRKLSIEIDQENEDIFAIAINTDVKSESS